MRSKKKKSKKIERLIDPWLKWESLGAGWKRRGRTEVQFGTYCYEFSLGHPSQDVEWGVEYDFGFQGRDGMEI